MNNGIAQRYRPGVLAVSPPDYDELPDDYISKARAELLSDTAWLAGHIAEAVDDVVADLLIDNGCATQRYRDSALCNRLRAAVDAAIERELPDLAESLWLRDVNGQPRCCG